MALASQSARGQSVSRSSSSMSRGRGRARRQRRTLGVTLLALVLVGISLYLVRSRDGGGGLEGGPAAASADTTPPQGATPLIDANPMTASRAAPKPVAAPPKRPDDAFTMEMANPRSRQNAAADAQQGIRIPNQPLAPTPVSGEAAPRAGTVGQQPNPDPVAQNEPLTATPGPGAAAPAVPAPARPADGSPSPDLAAAFAAAEQAQSRNQLVQARTVLNKALLDAHTPESDREALRRWMAELNAQLLFGPTIFPNEPFAETYKVASGDSLARINRKLGLLTEPSLISRVNRMANPNALQVGQTLKVVRGPFHAVVSKSKFRMDLYAGPNPGTPTATGPTGAEPGWVYVRSFPVGLGAGGSTPIAGFTVKENSKLINPLWRNPRSGETFQPDDPKNPIGERWIGLEGIDEAAKAFQSYGIHGTIQPESIGSEMSMGCVRMRAEDVELVYELLTPRVSVVKIVP